MSTNVHSSRFLQSLLVILFGLLGCTGCQSVKQKLDYWKQNGHRVGPNYSTPIAPVDQSFSQSESGVVFRDQLGDSNWWRVFNDPQLNSLIERLKSQNLSLKAACYRIKEARLQRNIAAANLFPQSQQTNSSFSHSQLSRNSGSALPGIPLTINDWTTSFDVGWEVDLWGRIRRIIDAADANLEGRIHDRDFVMVSLIGEAASLYIQIRSFDERIELARQNVELQEGSLKIAKARFKEGRTSKLDVVQAESNLASTKSLIPRFELARRQSLNAISVLLGTPPSSVPYLTDQPGQIPQIPTEVIVGIPAELISRRPDILAAEQNMAAQFEQIGIAEADLYPTFSISGTLGYQAAKLSDLISNGSFNGTIAPGFRWNILNYGRLKNAICVEEARFKQIQLDFENTVLTAQREVEDGIIEFIKRKEQYEFDQQTADANAESVKLAVASFKEGKTDFGRVFVVQTELVSAQDRLVETRASIALALINTYRALGGGWETDCCTNCQVDNKNFIVTESQVPVSQLETNTPAHSTSMTPINAHLLNE